MKLATWNVNSLKVRLPQLLPWLAQRGVSADGIPPTARAEEIDVDTWRALAARLAAVS